MNFFSTFKTLLKGLLVGAGSVIPGINSITLIALTGQYDKSILSIRHLNQKKSWIFLLILGISILCGIIALSPLVDSALTNYPRPAYLLIMGLIIGTLPGVYRSRRELRPTPSKLFIFALTLGALLLIHFSPGVSDTITTSPKIHSLLFLSGIITGITLIIPGTHSSIPLTMMGSYQLLHETIRTFSPSLLLIAIPGILIGILVSIFTISWALKRFRAHTHYAILGLLTGCLPTLWPGLAIDLQSLYAIGLSIVGIIIGYHLHDPS